MVAAIAAGLYLHSEAEPTEEILAAITAAVYQLLTPANLAVRIQRPNDNWRLAGRQKLMDSRNF